MPARCDNNNEAPTTLSQIISGKNEHRVPIALVRNDTRVIIDAPNSNYHRGLLPLHGVHNRVSIWREHLASHAHGHGRCNFSFTRPQSAHHPPRLLDALNCLCLSNLSSSSTPRATVKANLSSQIQTWIVKAARRAHWKAFCVSLESTRWWVEDNLNTL